MSSSFSTTDLASSPSTRAEEKLIKYYLPAGLMICFFFSLFLFVARPLPSGHHYELALKLSLELLVVWLIYYLRPEFLNHKLILALILLAGLTLGFYQLTRPRPDPEIIETYESVFKDLEEGRNPYLSSRIYHRNGNGQVVYQNFNYPPLELYPYWLFYRLFHVWDMTSLSLFLMFIQLLAAIILVLTFRGSGHSYLLAFLPLLVFSEITTNPAMNMLLVSIFMALLYRQGKKPSTANRLLLAIVIGLGLSAKFFFIPLAATYYFWQLKLRDFKSWLRVGGQALLALAVSWLLMLPFGPLNVIKSTIFYNLNLGERNTYTTFYPNILSSFFYLIGQPQFYGPVAVLILFLVILFGPKLSLYTAFLLSGITFLLVAPTPEPQYFGTLLLLALASKILKISTQPAGVMSGGEVK
ncbi:MAG TPA: hypothetical protein PLL62_06340 [Candidatus Saccharicenans sp.]|nr:hypothetical protein [Candidatus Saccharicenans sp.]HQM74836.1 hypothetical protein [Candidatus Saccharicenans sp.]